MVTTAPPSPELREQALERLKKRQDFRGRLLVYVVMNADDVDRRQPITDAAVDREVARLRGG